jgi:hypothetical protein
LHPSYDKMNEHGHEKKGHVKKGGSWIETQRGGSQTWEDHKQNHGWGGTLPLSVTKIVHLKY